MWIQADFVLFSDVNKSGCRSVCVLISVFSVKYLSILKPFEWFKVCHVLGYEKENFRDCAGWRWAYFEQCAEKFGTRPEIVHCSFAGDSFSNIYMQANKQYLYFIDIWAFYRGI